MNRKNLELARSKFLLDKLTGKLPPELKGGLATKLPPLKEMERDKTIMLQLQSSRSLALQSNLENDDERSRKDQ